MYGGTKNKDQRKEKEKEKKKNFFRELCKPSLLDIL